MKNKMTNCKACGKELAKGAKLCSNCGKEQRNFFIRHKILTGLIVVIILAAFGASSGGTTSQQSQEEQNTNVETSKNNDTQKEVALSIKASELAKAYEDNEVKADKDYKDKYIEISGTIDNIGVSLEQTYVVLSSENQSSITNIQCFFNEQSQIDKISNLSKGQQITLMGTVDGKSLNVGVSDCKLK